MKTLTVEEADAIIFDIGADQDVEDYEYDEETGTHYYYMDGGGVIIL